MVANVALNRLCQILFIILVRPSFERRNSALISPRNVENTTLPTHTYWQPFHQAVVKRKHPGWSSTASSIGSHSSIVYVNSVLSSLNYRVVEGTGEPALPLGWKATDESMMPTKFSVSVHPEWVVWCSYTCLSSDRP